MERADFRPAVPVYCLGDCNVDMIIPIQSLPVKGGCGFSENCKTDAGGTMINTATALKRLGVRALPLSKIGADLFGDMILSHLADQDIPAEMILRSERHQTGLVVGLVEPDGEKRWISVRLGAADIHLTCEELLSFELPKALFITGVVINEGVESRYAAVEYARKTRLAGGRVYLDPNIRVPDWQLPRPVVDAFGTVMPYVDVLLANEKELVMLGESEDADEAAETLLRRGASCVWVKLGGKGCRCVSSGGNLSFPPAPVRTLDTSGAGDAFNAAVIYSELMEFDIGQTGRFANLFAGYVVERYGTTAALPTDEEICKMLRQAGKPSRIK